MTADFMKFAKKIGLDGKKLEDSVKDMEKGMVDAILGRNLFKLRMSFGGHGKARGLRVICAYVRGEKCFFLTGYAKNQKSDLTAREYEYMKYLGQYYLDLNQSELSEEISDTNIIEVESHDQQIQK